MATDNPKNGNDDQEHSNQNADNVKEIDNIDPGFTLKKFWNWIKKWAKRAGKEIMILALTLYYCLMDRNTPLWAKNTIVAALAYLILPFDLIPDFLGPIGFADDFAALTAAAKIVHDYITSEHKERAKEKVDGLFNKKKKSKQSED